MPTPPSSARSTIDVVDFAWVVVFLLLVVPCVWPSLAVTLGLLCVLLSSMTLADENTRASPATETPDSARLKE